jgi:hypothetical protein
MREDFRSRLGEVGGVHTINQVFHELLTPGRPSYMGFSPGEPVIWLVNDWAEGLLNGSLGVVRDGDEDVLAIRCASSASPTRC